VTPTVVQDFERQAVAKWLGDPFVDDGRACDAKFKSNWH
jgi:hypothetical protein